MQIIHIDISNANIIPAIYAKQGDVGRKFQAVITDGGTAYNIPSGTTLSMWYSGTSGEGNYNQIGLDDDFLRSRNAFTISGNTVTVEMVAQMLSCPGGGTMCMVMNSAEGEQIATWNIPYIVEKIPGANSDGAKQYYTAYAQAAMREMSSALAAALEDAKQSGEFDGPRGIQGDKGEPGHTPERGVDYWTDADKQEIVYDIVETAMTPATPQMYGAVGDGVSDDTKAINDCLANNKRVYIPEGTYVVDPAVGLIVQNDQVLEMSENAIIKASVTSESKYNYAIYIRNVENVTVRGGKICGDRLQYPDSTLERGYGIYISNSKNVNIERCEISDFRGDCIIIESIKDEFDVYSDIVNKNITIADCKIHNALRHGITVMGVYGLVVKDTEIFNTKGKSYSTAIDAETHYEWQEMKDFRYENVRAYDCNNGIMFSQNVWEGTIRNVSIDHCDFDRAQFGVTGSVDIDWSDIRAVSVGALVSLTVSHSNLGTLYIKSTAKKVTANDCVFVCSEEAPEAIIFENSSSSESTVECEINGCVINSYTSDVRNISKGLVAIARAPSTFTLSGCTICVNNPNGVNVRASKIVRVLGCKIINKFNVAGYPSPIFTSNAEKNFVVGNVFDTTEASAQNADKAIFNSAVGDVFFANNVGVMTKKFGPYLTFSGDGGAGRTWTIMNNVFPMYPDKGYTANGVVYKEIDNVYSNSSTEPTTPNQLKPEFVNSIEECTDTTKLYVLPDGYIYAYMLTEIEGGAAFTNYASPTSGDWQEGYRYRDDGVLAAATSANSFVSNFIKCKQGDIIRIKGVKDAMPIDTAIGAHTWMKVKPYDAGGNELGQTKAAYYLTKPYSEALSKSLAQAVSVSDDGVYSYEIFWVSVGSSSVSQAEFSADVAQIRVSGVYVGSASDVIITVNEEIVYTEPTVGYQWANTGHAFVPADYEDRIIALEQESDAASAEISDLHGRVNYSVGEIYGLKTSITDLQNQVNSGARWFALGDSITEGYASITNGDGTPGYIITDPVNRWVNIVAQMNGYELTNYGIGGTGYLQGEKNARVLVDTIDFSQCDFVTLAYGVNDWKNAVNIGSMDDDIASGGSMVANMRYVIKKILEKNPYCKIFVITPINCRSYGYYDTNWGINYKGTATKSLGLEDIFQRQKEVCEYYGIELIDMTHSSIINRENIGTILADYVHPTVEGHKMIARELAQKITLR